MNKRKILGNPKLKILTMLFNALCALGMAALAAHSGNAMFDAWYWMPVVWGVIVLLGLIIGIVHKGYFHVGEGCSDLLGKNMSGQSRIFAVRNCEHCLRILHRATNGVAAILMAFAGAVIAALTGKVFLGLPLSWWIFGMGILAMIGAFDLVYVLRNRGH